MKRTNPQVKAEYDFVAQTETHYDNRGNRKTTRMVSTKEQRALLERKRNGNTVH